MLLCGKVVCFVHTVAIYTASNIIKLQIRHFNLDLRGRIEYINIYYSICAIMEYFYIYLQHQYILILFFFSFIFFARCNRIGK